jgi:opacity protein-like surface antigen
MIKFTGWLTLILTVCGLLVLFQQTANAESYVAGFAGYGLSAQLSDVRGTGDIAGRTGSNLDLQNSPIYGLKVGHFLDGLKYFGGEAELYTATPYLKQQQLSLSSPTQTATIPGAHQRVTTAAFNVVYRYPGQVVQPYAGVGLGLFWFTTPTSTAGSEVRPGLNVLAGTRVLVTEQMALFGEYKYNHTSFPGGDFNANYNAHFVVFGVGYHF